MKSIKFNNEYEQHLYNVEANIIRAKLESYFNYNPIDIKKFCELMNIESMDLAGFRQGCATFDKTEMMRISLFLSSRNY